MQITDLASQKNNPKRFNLFLDGKFVLGLDVETVVKKDLKIGQILTEKEWEKLSSEVLEETFFANALNFLSFRPRSEKEIKDHFRKKKIDDKKLSELVNKLKEKGLIDEEKFCEWWVEQRQTFRPKGRRMLEQELWQKGIHRDIINKVLHKAKIAESEKEICLTLAQKWLAKHHLSLKEPKDKERLFRHLASRGFDFETIQNSVDTLSKKG